MFRILIISLLMWLTCSFAQARQSLPLDTGNTEIMLISDVDTAAPGASFTVALRMKFDGNWYTYWRNAGDSGEPVHIVWDLPDGVTAGPISWPAPKTKTVGPIVSYAMDIDVWLPVEISLNENIDPNAPITLRAHAYYLVCDDICIPEDGALTLPMAVGPKVENPTHSVLIKSAQSKIPKLGKAQGSAHLENGQVVFNITSLPNGFESAALFPNENPVIIHSNPIDLANGQNGNRYSAVAGYGWDDGVSESFEATLVAEDGGAIVVPIATDRTIDIGPVKSGGQTANIGFWGALIGAFIGGLILNLMPCVFPIISLKALSLSKTAHSERTEIRSAAWAYTAGVLVSFVLFAGLITGLKAGGASIGWGFQLQSPWLVGLLSLLLFTIGLNLLGVFELSGRIQNIGINSANKSGAVPSFLTGVLAVIVATPCTAPFMASAVGLALASSAAVTLAIFLALGAGFALPFLLVAYVPGLLTRLPKPGAWMEYFKQFLAFPMFAAAIWLAWVLSLQAGAAGTLKLLSAGLIISFGIWIINRGSNTWKIIGGITILIAFLLPFSLTPSNQTTNLSAKTWSAQAVAAARAEGRPVFVDFTAAWCVTCKVNEGLVLKKTKTAKLFERTDTEFLIADWTNKDDVIAAELKRYGRAGVPLYLAYKPGAAEAEVLPQVLTYEILKDALE